MMLFWIFVIILLVGIGCIVLGSVNWDYEKHHFLWFNEQNFAETGAIIAVISGIAVIVMLIVIIISHSAVDAQLACHRERFEALTYKVESTEYRDEFGLLNKSVVNEIQEWNEDLVYNKAIQRDFWLGIFHPNIYDEFETIEYKEFKRE